MRNWMKNGARAALLVAGFAAVGGGIANADTIGGRSHLAAVHGTTAGAGLSGSTAGRFSGGPAGGDDLGTAASSGLSLSGRKGLQSSGTLCGSSAVSSIVQHAACGNAGVTHHHLGTGLAGSGTLTGRRGNVALPGSALVR
ncbi:hypothetical protein ACRYCC_38885 [Actinomadura scrupuli]|uniref:hypothetical protein n=1 Tax=Actinomadura scrupuli TaxID=559629 RepID=UPI003D98209B